MYNGDIPKKWFFQNSIKILKNRLQLYTASKIEKSLFSLIFQYCFVLYFV